MSCYRLLPTCFNTQPPKGGWVKNGKLLFIPAGVSTHSRLKAAGQIKNIKQKTNTVSTHSRLKAAGRDGACRFDWRHRFNTQPPKGGWSHSINTAAARRGFNTQPPKGGWPLRDSSHSRSELFQHTAA